MHTEGNPMSRKTRKSTRDVAFQFRMPAGFPGDVNRTHPCSIEPAINDSAHPVAYVGYPVLVNPTSNDVRGVLGTDTGITLIYGVAVRAFPLQQATADGPYGAQNFGAYVPPAGQPIDVLKQGYIMVQVNVGASSVAKGSTAYVRITIGGSSPAGAVVGGFEGANDATSGALTVALTNAVFNGPADANGIAELIIRN
jgi:hypothetical protein